MELGVTGLGTEESPWVLEGLVSTFPNGTAISITGLPEAYVKLKGVNATGKVGLFVSGLKFLEIENLSAEGIEAVILQDIEELKVRRIDATARDTAIYIADVEKGDVKDLRVHKGSDGVVLHDYTGTVVQGDLRVADNGVVADDFRGYIQNMIVQGECTGIGLTFTGGNPNLIGNAAHCAETGILITEAGNATMNGDAVAFARDGIVVRETRLEARGLAVKAVEGAGILVTGANATLTSVTVTNARTGIALSDGSFAVVGAVVTDIEESALLVENARLCESGGLYTTARTGMRFASVEGQIAAGCGGGVLVIAGPPAPPAGTTTIDDAETGIEFVDSVLDAGTVLIGNLWGEGVGVRALRGARTGAFPWQTLKVQNLAGGTTGTGIVATEGADLSVKDFHADGLATLALLGSGARLKLLAGTTGLFQPNERGFRVTDRAMLDMKSVTATMTKGPFVHANDSFVRDDASAVAGVFPGGRVEEEGFRLVRADVHVKNSRVTNARLGVYVEGLPEGIEGKPPVAPKFEGLSLQYNREGGIQLVDTAAEVTGGTILYSGERPNPFFAKPPAGTAHGILVRNSGFVLAGGLRVNTNDGDGLHWDGGTSVPASSLFPPGPDGKSTSTPRIDQVTFSSNVGNGIAAQNAARELGFRIDRSTAVLNRGSGADFRDVNVQISDSEFSDNALHGIRSVWSQPGKDEVFDIRKSAFGNSCCDGNTLNGVDLTGHGEKTSIQNSYFNDTGTNLGTLQPEASYGHHVALWNSTRGAGPLVANNWFGDSYYCAIKLNRSNARIYDNAFRSVISGSDGYNGFTCGVFAQRVAAYEVKGNRFGVIGLGVLSANSSGSIVGNRFNATGPGLAWIEGDGSQTVTVTDNRVVSGTRNVGTPRYATDIFVAACETGSLSPMICFSNVGGSIARNELDGGAARTDPRCPTDPWVRVECRLGQATRMILIRRGPATPEIFANNITTKGFGLDLWTPPGCCLGADRSPDAGQWYDGANRIHDNVFDSYFTDGDTTSRITAIRDHHGSYGGDPVAHNPPLGANVAGNSFRKGAYVECHYSGYDFELDRPILDTRYACTNGAGQQTVMSHQFSGSAAGSSGPQAHPPFQDLTTRERTPGDLRTTVRDVPSVDRGFSIGTPTLRVTRTLAVRTFEFHGVATWTEAGFWYGKMRDSEGDIRIEFLVDGTVVKSVTGTEASPYGETIRRANVTFAWQAPAEALYEIKLRVSLVSKTKDPALGSQRMEDTEKAWAGRAPFIEKIESNRGNVFLQGVPIPGGVKFTAKVHWPDNEHGYVVFKYAGKEQRAFGKSPSIVTQPPIDFPETLSNPADGFGLSGAVVHAQAFTRTDHSTPASTRVKLLPFPLAVLELISRGETKVSFYDLSPGVAGKQKVVYDWDLQFWSFEKKVKVPIPGFEGSYEGKSKAGAKVKLDSTGPGYVGIRGLLEFKREPEGIRPGDEFKFTGSLAGGGIAEIDDVKLKGVFLQPKLEGDLIIAIMIVDVYPVLKGVAQIPLVGRAITELNSRVRIELGIGAAAEGLVKLEAKEGASCVKADWKCSGELKIQPRFTVALVGRITDDIKAKAYGRGSFFVTGKIPGDTYFVGVKEIGLDGELGLELKAYSYEKKWKTNLALVIASPGRGFNVSTETEWAIPARDWTDGGTFRGLPEHVVANLTRDGDPSFAFASDGRAAVVWIRDDPSKPYPRSGEVAVAVRDASGVWHDLGAVTSDERLDALPSIAPLANGRWLVAWTRDTDASLSTSTPLSAASGTTFETMAAVVAPGAISVPVALTSDSALDSAATALAAPDGTGAVVWRKNAAGSLVSADDAPDDVWATPVAADGTFGAPAKVVTGETALGRAFAWDGSRVLLAGLLPNGSVVLRNAAPGGAASTTYLGNAATAPPAIALAVDGAARRVAWLRANASNDMAFDLVETVVDEGGVASLATRVAEGVGPEHLVYAPGSPRALVWTQPRDGTAVLRAQADATGWGPVEEVDHAPGFLDLLAARGGAALEAAVLETHLDEVAGTFNYTGANVEDPGETISLSRNTTTLVPARRDVRLHALAPLPPPAPPPFELEVVAFDAAETAMDAYRLTAYVHNNGVSMSEPFVGELAAGPYDGPATVTAPVAIPAIPAGWNGTVAAEITVPPTASGWWRVNLTGRGLAGLPAVLRLAPEWELPGGDVRREGATVDFRLANAGPRAGSTRVTAIPIRPDGSLAPAVADAEISVPARGATDARLTLPAGTGPVLLLANPPQTGVEIDQADFGGTVAVAASLVDLFEYAGEVTVPAGAHSFEIDLSPFAGVGEALGATFDGTPLPLTVERGIVRGTVIVTEGTHDVAVRVADLLGGERTLRLVVRTPGATGGGGGSGGDGGTGGDGTGGGTGGDGTTGGVNSNETPPTPVPWYTKIAKFFGIPGASPMLLLATALVVALAARRRNERP